MFSGCRQAPPDPVVQAVDPPCFTIEDLSATLPTTRGWRTNPSLLDVDGDGDLDLAATTRKSDDPTVFLHSPGGWTPKTVPLGSYPCGVGVELAEIDGDGFPDLLVSDHCTGLHLFRGDGRGAFTRLAHLEHPTGEGFNDAAAGDLDGDGRTDLVAVAAFSTGYSVFRGTPSGFMPVATGLPRSGWGWDVSITDLDGDGVADILGTLQGLKPVARSAGQREAKAFLQRDAGTFVPAEGLPESGNYFGIDHGDFDEDGLTDIAIANRDVEGGVLLFRGTGHGAWEPAEPVGRDHARTFAGVRTADLDRDGHLDLVAVEHRTPAVVAWLGAGDGTFRECPDRPGPLTKDLRPGWGVAVGDVDGDGALEIVAGFGSETGGALRAWSFRPAAAGSPAP